MNANFTPAAHYWLVNGNATHVFSSAAVAYVPIVESTYQAWLAAGNLPAHIDSEASLWDVLAQQAPQCLPADVRRDRRRSEAIRLLRTLPEPIHAVLLAMSLEAMDELREIKKETPKKPRTIPELIASVCSRIDAGEIDVGPAALRYGDGSDRLQIAASR